MSSTTPDLARIRTAIDQFQQRSQTLLLASVSVDGLPEISYAPFVTDGQGAFHIYVSELAAHTRNLLTNRQAAWMLIADEQDSKQLMARERLTFHGQVSEVERGSPQWEAQLQRLEARCGDVMALVRPLADFHLLRLQARDALYVRGFGQAFRLSGERLAHLEHVQGR